MVLYIQGTLIFILWFPLQYQSKLAGSWTLQAIEAPEQSHSCLPSPIEPRYVVLWDLAVSLLCWLQAGLLPYTVAKQRALDMSGCALLLCISSLMVFIDGWDRWDPYSWLPIPLCVSAPVPSTCIWTFWFCCSESLSECESQVFSHTGEAAFSILSNQKRPDLIGNWHRDGI